MNLVMENSKESTGPTKKRNELLDSFENRINDIIDEFEINGKDFSLDDLEKAYKDKKSDAPSVFSVV